MVNPCAGSSSPQGRYQFDGLGSRMVEMQGVDGGYQRPKSGGYRGNVMVVLFLFQKLC